MHAVVIGVGQMAVAIAAIVAILMWLTSRERGPVRSAGAVFLAIVALYGGFAAFAIIADSVGVPLGVGDVIAVSVFGGTSAAAFAMALRGWRTQHS